MGGEQRGFCLHGAACKGGKGCSLVYMDPMMPGEGRRMVKAFSALGAPVWLFNRKDALFWKGVVRESLPCGDGGVLLWLWLWWLWLLRLFILQVNSLVPSKGGGVIESFATVSAGVTLSL